MQRPCWLTRWRSLPWTAHARTRWQTTAGGRSAAHTCSPQTPTIPLQFASQLCIRAAAGSIVRLESSGEGAGVHARRLPTRTTNPGQASPDQTSTVPQLAKAHETARCPRRSRHHITAWHIARRTAWHSKFTAQHGCGPAGRVQAQRGPAVGAHDHEARQHRPQQRLRTHLDQHPRRHLRHAGGRSGQQGEAGRRQRVGSPLFMSRK